MSRFFLLWHVLAVGLGLCMLEVTFPMADGGCQWESFRVGRLLL